MLVDVTIEGTSPLLQHVLSEEGEVADRAAAPSRPRPREAAAQVAYRLPDGRLYQPSAHLLGAFRTAAWQHCPRRVARACKQAFSILEPELVHEIQGWEADSRPVMETATGRRSLRHRPRLNRWRLHFTAEIDTRLLTLEDAYAVLNRAGLRVGIGDYRPEQGGIFGRFRVTTWQPRQNDGQLVACAGRMA